MEELEVGTESQTVEECCLVNCFLWLAHFDFFLYDQEPPVRGYTTVGRAVLYQSIKKVLQIHS